MKGALLFVAGALLGANLAYLALTRQAPDTEDATTAGATRAQPPQGDDGQPSGAPPSRGPSTRPATAPPAPARVRAPSPPPVEVSGASGAAAPPATGSLPLLLPVRGVAATALRDTFNEARAQGRSHEAIDIMAPAGTPVLAVADGTVEKLFTSEAGGLTVYQFEPTGQYAYYYAHLQGYAPGLAERQTLRRGDVIGYVGSTGNANPAAPHLHFAVFQLGPERRWWQGTALNPYPLLRGR